MKGWKKIFYANEDQRKVRVAILISDKIDFKIKAVKRDKEGHYTMIKGSIQEDITTINIFAPNIGAPQYIRQMLTSTKGEINSNTIIVGDFNTQLTLMNRSTKQKISKETQALNDTMDQLDLIDIYRTFWDFLVAQMVKRLPAMQEIWVQSLGWEGPLEKEMATHSSTLA